MVKQTLIILAYKKEEKNEEKETTNFSSELITIFIAMCRVEIYIHVEWGMVFESIH